jgi:hypothetical protein
MIPLLQLAVSVDVVLASTGIRQPSMPRRAAGSVRSMKKESQRYFRGEYAPGQEAFMFYCKLALGHDAGGDNLTQNLYADFLFDYCSHSTRKGAECVPSGNPDSFVSLPTDLQLLFVKDLCPLTSRDEALQCLTALLLRHGVLRYENAFEGLCSKTYPVIGQTGLLLASKSPILFESQLLRRRQTR